VNSQASPFIESGAVMLSLPARSAVLTCCLLLGAALIAQTTKNEPTPLRTSLAVFPSQVGSWSGTSAERFDQRILTVLGVDDYISRTYTTPGRPPAHLYIGFYRSQRNGATMHSPLNCLPGAGWQPVERKRVPIDVLSGGTGTTKRSVVVNQITIEKGLARQVVVYWYQSHGRVTASEYLGKVYTVLDALRLNRTDAAMIRIVSPVVPGVDPAAAAASAASLSVEFAQAVFPLLGTYLPD
jgi:EpsI family protein